MNLELGLRYHPQAQRSATAWYFPSADVAEWLNVLCRSGWDQAALRCVPIPRSRTDLSPRGVLFVSAQFAKPHVSRKEQVAPRPSPWQIDRRLQPFGELHARFYLPVEASLNAALSPDEFSELQADADSLLVWLPDLGLISLASDEALRVADLLQAPPWTEGRWSFAEPAPALNTRLLSLQPWDPPTLANFRQSAQDDIGTQSAKAGDLPPSPREAAPGVVAGASRALAQGIAGTVAATAGMLDKLKQLFSAGPQSTSNASAAQPQPASPSLLTRIRQWAAQTQQQITDSVSAARDRELTRLLDLLQNNPDEGLRYAIPLAGDAPRGVAPPGAQLTARDINFRSGGSGSGPADYWDIAYQNRLALIARYRDLANREIALGRHRRAAYIFAELLGDYGAAAQTLADGRHHREAALIYEERLKNPRQAAKCLELGGLLHEAIEIYRKLNEHETVGDLYQRLEQPDLAGEAYEQALAALLQAGNYLGSAELCRTKLQSHERALDTLEAGWQESTNQRQSCFLRSFELLGQASQHERAHRFLNDAVAKIRVTKSAVTTFVPDLATVATTYPEPALRDWGKDQARQLIGQHLGENPTQQRWEQQSLLQALNKLEPADRLLARDTRRFESNMAKLQPAFPVDKRMPAPVRAKIQQRREAPLPCQDCRALVSHGNHFYVAGLYERELMFFRGDHQGRIHYPNGKRYLVPAEIVDSFRPALHWNSAGKEKILLWPHLPNLADRTFPAVDGFPDEVTIGGVPMIDQFTLAATYNGSPAISCLQFDGRSVCLNHYADHSGRLLKSHPIQIEPDYDDADANDFCLHSHFEHWFIGFNRQLWIGQGARDPREVELPGEIRGFVAAPANSLFRLVALLDEGIFLTWGYLTNLQHTRAANQLAKPVGCFTAKGELILVGTNGIEIYSTNQHGLRMIAERKSLTLNPIGVMSIEGTQEFIVVQQNGLATTFSW